MSWSVTLNDITAETAIPQDVFERMLTQHLTYAEDMILALDVAKKARFKSATLTGFRTPNPYGGDEVAEITVRGFTESRDLNEQMLGIIKMGPHATGAIPSDAAAAAAYAVGLAFRAGADDE